MLLYWILQAVVTQWSVLKYYTEWSKNLCAPDDYSTIIRCTETFWSPCIILWDHRRMCDPSLTETSLCGALLDITRSQQQYVVRAVHETAICRNPPTDNFIEDRRIRRFLNVVWFLLGNYPASEFYTATFRNTLFHLHRRIGMEDDHVWEMLQYLYGKKFGSGYFRVKSFPV